MLLANALKITGDKKNEATPMIKPKPIIFKLLILRIICLLSFQDNAEIVTNNKTSVIAVPRPTPKAGLF